VNQIGKVLVITGAVIAGVGLAFLLAGKVPFLGRLPGDVRIKTGEHSEIFLPVTTCLVLSVVLSIVVNLVMWLLAKRPH